ncbi:MAG: hemerythrin domain-containing protein [Actinobacteria bacterium]|nr:hemerythrin domain-containing protein [Actinomycetota bacterium]
MASPPAMRRQRRADWTLMAAIHEALRRDLDELLHPAASRPPARARWIAFREQLRFHLAAEKAVVWPSARARLTDNPRGQALLDAMEDEQQLIGPLLAVTDDAFTMDADPMRIRQLLARLRTRLTSHLAHKESEALPLIWRIMSERELGRITRAICGGRCLRQAARTVPWALAHASPQIRDQVLSQFPAPARVLHRKVWLPRYARTARPAGTSTRSAVYASGYRDTSRCPVEGRP